jgi:hypothetical protein
VEVDDKTEVRAMKASWLLLAAALGGCAGATDTNIKPMSAQESNAAHERFAPMTYEPSYGAYQSGAEEPMPAGAPMTPEPPPSPER